MRAIKLFRCSHGLPTIGSWKMMQHIKQWALLRHSIGRTNHRACLKPPYARAASFRIVPPTLTTRPFRCSTGVRPFVLRKTGEAAEDGSSGSSNESANPPMLSRPLIVCCFVLSPWMCCVKKEVGKCSIGCPFKTTAT